MHVAIVGSGISGMVAASRLHLRHEVTVFEAGSHVGGHTHTIDVQWQGRHYAIDTGFIVFNDWTYPRFIALLEELGVEYQDSNMSFSLCDERSVRNTTADVNTLFAQRMNAAPVSFRMIAMSGASINAAPIQAAAMKAHAGSVPTCKPFAREPIACRWACRFVATERAMLSFPARFFVEFFDKHGFLSVDWRPVWQATRAARAVHAQPQPLAHPAQHAGHLRAARSAGVTIQRRVHTERFDYVLACTATPGVEDLRDPSDVEADV
jgi:predicted NAD/FAD-binding protein